MKNEDTATVILVLQKAGIKSEECLAAAIVKTLAKYLDMVKNYEAGHDQQEVFEMPDGTTLSVTAASSIVRHMPHTIPVQPRVEF